MKEKNFFRLAALICIAASILLISSCGDLGDAVHDDLDDYPDTVNQVILTITNMPDDLNGKYGYVGLGRMGGEKMIQAAVSLPVEIRGNKVICRMIASRSHKPFRKTGELYIVLLINETGNPRDPDLHIGFTEARKLIEENTTIVFGDLWDLADFD